MKRLYALLFLPCFIFAQYWGERVTEKSFESSDLYFNSYFLNTFGLYQFRDVAVGLLDDPFLRLQINPALFPDKSETKTYLYLDFRGDRTEAQVINYNIYPPYYDYASSYAPIRPIDPRWYAVTRSEPEPVFSFGILTHPWGERLFLGATYQMLFRQESYYQTPTWIYNTRYGYDAAGSKLVGNEADIPIVDRYAGSDEMLTSGHLLGGYVGYRVHDNIQIGLNMNSVFHNREGQYANLRNDQYSSSDDRDWFSSYAVERNQDYDHFDISAGISYQINEQWRAGIKAGVLQGEVQQTYSKYDSSVYHYNYNNPDNWSRSFRLGSTTQNWDHDGQGRYGSFHLDYRIVEKSVVSFYYNYRSTAIDLRSVSNISDTSYYAGEWTSTYRHSSYESGYSFTDNRTASGKNDRTRQEAMFSVRWQETDRVTVFFGVYVQNYVSNIDTREPVLARNQSHYFYQYENFEDQQDYEYSSTYALFEDKNLLWQYRSERQSLQIPVMLTYRINPSWEILLGINRMWEHWKISDQTTALFARRTKNENGTIKDEQNFGERYTQPEQKFTDNQTAFVAGMGVQLTPRFKINILVDPQNEPEWRIAQWWLSFRATL